MDSNSSIDAHLLGCASRRQTYLNQSCGLTPGKAKRMVSSKFRKVLAVPLEIRDGFILRSLRKHHGAGRTILPRLRPGFSEWFCGDAQKDRHQEAMNVLSSMWG